MIAALTAREQALISSNKNKVLDFVTEAVYTHSTDKRNIKPFSIFKREGKFLKLLASFATPQEAGSAWQYYRVKKSGVYCDYTDSQR